MIILRKIRSHCLKMNEIGLRSDMQDYGNTGKTIDSYPWWVVYDRIGRQPGGSITAKTAGRSYTKLIYLVKFASTYITI
jgi:hypothetical protein